MFKNASYIDTTELILPNYLTKGLFFDCFFIFAYYRTWVKFVITALV